jgi:hypothetical protein
LPADEETFTDKAVHGFAEAGARNTHSLANVSLTGERGSRFNDSAANCVSQCRFELQVENVRSAPAIGQGRLQEDKQC